MTDLKGDDRIFFRAPQKNPIVPQKYLISHTVARIKYQNRGPIAKTSTNIRIEEYEFGYILSFPRAGGPQF